MGKRKRHHRRQHPGRPAAQAVEREDPVVEGITNAVASLTTGDFVTNHGTLLPVIRSLMRTAAGR